MDEVPSAVFDSGATSNCGLQSDPFQPTGKPSGKVFHLLTGHTTTASQQAKLLLDVREPAKTVDMVPGLRHNSLLSASKVADAGYVIVLTPDAVNVYNGSDFSRIKVDAVLRGWRDTNGLWRVPLEPNKPPKDSEYVLLDQEAENAISNVYKLPSTAKIIQYLHACAGFPAKQTWLKAINGGNYAIWSHLTAEAVRKHFRNLTRRPRDT